MRGTAPQKVSSFKIFWTVLMALGKVQNYHNPKCVRKLVFGAHLLYICYKNGLNSLETAFLRCALKICTMEVSVSGRQFAKILGCSEGNVRKLLARGKISEKSLDRSDPSCVKIFVERAKIEVAENQTHVHNADPVKKAKTRHNRAERVLTLPKPTPVKPQEPSINNLPQGLEKPLTEMTLNELDKISKIRDIRMKEIKIEQELKILVPIAAVDEALFEGGQQVREALENMPSRVVDQLLGLTDRDEMLNIMEVEIFEILTKLADIGDKLPR